jgi:cytochrome d ubiquinol oxidase subunit I
VASRTLKLATVVGFIAAVVVAFPTGHVHAQQVARTQPEKFAAMEGLYTGQSGAPLAVFGVVSPGEPELKAAIQIPNLLSYMAFGDVDAEVKGIKDFPEDDVPKGAELWLTFVSFHNMVILGTLFIAVTGFGVFLMWRKKILESRLFLRAFMICLPLPVLACQFGWTAAEVGRQPWVVYKVLRTSEAASITVPAGNILFSIVMFGLVYLGLGALWIFLLSKKIGKGPAPAAAAEGGA